jgi:hypothetical protein
MASITPRNLTVCVLEPSKDSYTHRNYSARATICLQGVGNASEPMRDIFSISSQLGKYTTCRKISPSFVENHVVSQTADVQGGKGKRQGIERLVPLCPFHLPFPTYCEMAGARRYSASSTNCHLPCRCSITTALLQMID